MATWSQIFRALALKLAKIQRWKEKGVIFQFSFKNPGIAKKALVKNIFFFILELTFCNYLSFSIEKSRVFLKKTWWQISSSVRPALDVTEKQNLHNSILSGRIFTLIFYVIPFM